MKIEHLVIEGDALRFMIRAGIMVQQIVLKLEQKQKSFSLVYGAQTLLVAYVEGTVVVKLDKDGS